MLKTTQSLFSFQGGEVPARTALGATTVLSIVNLGFGGKSKPKVGYATALDMYIILCLFAVFAALVEFACINFIDTFIKRFKKWEAEQNVCNEPIEKVNVTLETKNSKDVATLNSEENGLTVDIIEDSEKELVIVIENGKNPKVFTEKEDGNPFKVPFKLKNTTIILLMNSILIV